MRRSNSFGFTLVELLVVIAIIGTLVAILLPAIQAAREAARRSSCVNHLKQLGIGISNYESVKKRFPPGAIWDRWGPESKRRRHGSILVHLLPYVEEQATYDAFDFKILNTDGAFLPGGERIAGHRVETYICPSDDHNGTFESKKYGIVAVHNYAASNGPTEVYNNPNCSCIHPWKSYEMAPIDNLDKFAGPFTRLGVMTKARQITDGLSKTIFMGEVRVPCSVHARAGWAITNNGNGYCTTLIPINYDSCSDEAPDACHRNCSWNTDVGFKSAHSGGANFLFGDGSVHFIPESIDHQMYQNLGAKNDGNLVEVTF
jgi:prepilin-type N-terminal cleavage/methylation domain-containing protein/prepilin-type processing-associated H-X9-DG protein